MLRGRIIFSFFAWLWLASAAWGSPVPPAEELILIGGDHNYPPYEFLDTDGLPSGFNVELSRAVAEVMGMEVEIRLGPWDRMRYELSVGQVDLLQGMAVTRERRDEVDFSTPHAKVHQSIWVRTGSKINSLRDLVNKQVIVMRGSVMHDYMLRRPELGARLLLVETLENALYRLAAGEADAALVAKLPGQYLLQRSGLDTIHPIPKPLVSQDYAYAVKKGNADLLARFNEGLKLLEQSGRYRQIYEKWLGVLPPPGISSRELVRIGALVVGPLLLLLFGTFFWSRTLRQQVSLRTSDLQQEVAEKEHALQQLEVRQRQLIQADKLTSLGTLTSGMAHEINNPNALLLLNLPLLSKAWQDALPVLQEHYRQHGDFKLGGLNFSRMQQEIPLLLEDMQQCAGRIKRIVEDLKDFARQDSAVLNEAVDLNRVAEAALRLVDNSLKKATEALRVELAAELPSFRGNQQRIEQVIINLLLNACQALTGRGQAIRLTTGMTAEGWLQLEICDQGEGIAEENLAKLTDPFFTTKRESGGTGLGLSVSAGIVHEHGGQLQFASTQGEGTCVRLLLPPEEKSDERQ